MNYYYLTNQIHASSQEQRERIIEEIQKKPIGDKYYCRYYSCERNGDCDIILHVSMRGGINPEVYDILDTPLKYPDVTEEERGYTEVYPSYHRIYRNDSLEDIWTIEDAIELWDTGYCDFSPSMLEMELFRRVYDNNGNQISEEKETVPYPIERMSEGVRREYEKWKENPIKWEEDKKKEKQEAQNRVNTPTFNDDCLPF